MTALSDEELLALANAGLAQHTRRPRPGSPTDGCNMCLRYDWPCPDADRYLQIFGAHPVTIDLLKAGSLDSNVTHQYASAPTVECIYCGARQTHRVCNECFLKDPLAHGAPFGGEDGCRS